MTLRSTNIRTIFFPLFGSEPIADGSSGSLPAFTSTVWDEGVQPLFLISLAKASKNYNGNSVRLLRLSDFQERSFGFDQTNEVDALAIQSWASNAGCKIVTGFDQSGQGNNALSLSLRTSFDFNPIEVRIEASTGVSSGNNFLYIADISVSPVYAMFANAIKRNNTGSIEHIIGTPVTGSTFPYSGLVFAGSTDSAGIGQLDSGTALSKDNFSIDDDAWHRLIGVFASANSKFYADRTNTTAGSTGTTNYKKDCFVIGSTKYWSGTRQLTTGFLDFAAVVPTSLGDTEVSAYDAWMQANTSRS